MHAPLIAVGSRGTCSRKPTQRGTGAPIMHRHGPTQAIMEDAAQPSTAESACCAVRLDVALALAAAGKRYVARRNSTPPGSALPHFAAPFNRSHTKPGGMHHVLCRPCALLHGYLCRACRNVQCHNVTTVVQQPCAQHPTRGLLGQSRRSSCCLGGGRPTCTGSNDKEAVASMWPSVLQHRAAACSQASRMRAHTHSLHVIM